jgi:predicted kinase
VYGKELSREEEWNLKSVIATEILGLNIALYANKSKKNIFYDGTNLKAETRNAVLRHLSKDTFVEALVFRVPIETVLERAKMAEKDGSRKGFHSQSINERDLRLMDSWFEEPKQEEGFQEIKDFKPPSEPSQELFTIKIQ